MRELIVQTVEDAVEIDVDRPAPVLQIAVGDGYFEIAADTPALLTRMVEPAEDIDGMLYGAPRVLPAWSYPSLARPLSRRPLIRSSRRSLSFPLLLD